jgi:hypothetical protein
MSYFWRHRPFTTMSIGSKMQKSSSSTAAEMPASPLNTSKKTGW